MRLGAGLRLCVMPMRLARYALYMWAATELLSGLRETKVELARNFFFSQIQALSVSWTLFAQSKLDGQRVKRHSGFTRPARSRQGKGETMKLFMGPLFVQLSLASPRMRDLCPAVRRGLLREADRRGVSVFELLAVLAAGGTR